MSSHTQHVFDEICAKLFDYEIAKRNIIIGFHKADGSTLDGPTDAIIGSTLLYAEPYDPIDFKQPRIWTHPYSERYYVTGKIIRTPIETADIFRRWWGL